MMTKPENPADGGVTCVAHAPERRRRSTTLGAAGCCCCCCCCLHSIGSVSGALYGGAKGRNTRLEGVAVQDLAREQAERRAADSYTVKVYWLSLLIIAILSVFVCLLESRNENLSNAMLIFLLVLALGLPFGQMGASVLALIYLNVFPPPRKAHCLKRLGRISLWAFLWGLIGFAVMVPFAFMMK